MMLKNMALCAVLVILGWVILGMAVAFLGAFAVMPRGRFRRAKPPISAAATYSVLVRLP